MARRSPSRGPPRQAVFPAVPPRAAGSDMGATWPVVAGPPALCPEPVSTAQRFTGALPTSWPLGASTWVSPPWRWSRRAVTGCRSLRGVRRVRSRSWWSMCGLSSMALGGRRRATPRSGCSHCRRMAYCGGAATRHPPGRPAAHTGVTARAGWNRRPRTSSPGQKRCGPCPCRGIPWGPIARASREGGSSAPASPASRPPRRWPPSALCAVKRRGPPCARPWRGLPVARPGWRDDPPWSATPAPRPRARPVTQSATPPVPPWHLTVRQRWRPCRRRGTRRAKPLHPSGPGGKRYCRGWEPL
jgi:hypothetical protein